MRRGKSRRQGQTLYLKRIAFSLWLLYYLLLRSNPSFRTHRVQRDLNFVVVGFYEGAVQCEALLSAVAVGATFIPLNLSTHDGTSVTERQRRALRGLGRTAPNPYLQVHSLRWDAVVLGIELEKFSLLTRTATLPGISVEIYNQLRRGTIFVPANLNSTSAFLGLLKHVRRSHQRRVRDIQGSFFCRLPDQDECTDALAVTRDGSPRELQGMDWNASFDAMGQRHKNAVRVCQNEKVALIGEKFPKQPVSVSHFWINTNDQITRKRSMHSMLKSSGLVSTRIEGWTEKKIAYMLESGRVLLPSSLERYESSTKFLREVACTVSHLSAIHHAYESGAELALITEDDVDFSPNFAQKLNIAITSAPHEWEVLQILTVNTHILGKHANLYATDFVKWYPTHWSSAAYVISKRGMEIALGLWKFRETRGVLPQLSTFSWEFPEDDIYLADETIFQKTRSYTLVKSILRLAPSAVHSAIQDRAEGVVPGTYAQNPSPRVFAPSSLMIVSSMRVSQVSDYYRNVGLLLQNFKEFRKHVKRVQMKINVVCVHDSTARNVTEIVARSHERLLGVSTSVLVNPRMFNKFIFVSEALHDFEVFEKVLLLDSDMDLMGFAIPEYFELVANYVIGGTVHQNVDEMLSKNYDKASRQWFKIFNGAWWQNHAPDVLMFETKFVEQAFVLMDARFAQWFFTRILSEKHLFFTDKAGIKRQRQSDFGPDLLWCGAAEEWLQTQHSVWWSKPCAVSTFPIYHTDDRQLEMRSSGEFSNANERAWVQRRTLNLYRKHFKRWYAYSSEFVRQVGGKVVLDKKFKSELLKGSVRCIRCKTMSREAAWPAYRAENG